MKVLMVITSDLDNRCILPGTVIVSSSEDLSENRYSQTSSSTGSQKWTEHTVLGMGEGRSVRL